MGEPRIGQAMCELAILSQQQEALAVMIEPAGGVDSRNRNERGKCRSSREIAELAEHAIGLVKRDRAEMFWHVR